MDAQFVQVPVSLVVILAIAVESPPTDVEKQECNITNVDAHLSQKILNKKVSYIGTMIKTKNI